MVSVLSYNSLLQRLEERVALSAICLFPCGQEVVNCQSLKLLLQGPVYIPDISLF